MEEEPTFNESTSPSPTAPSPSLALPSFHQHSSSTIPSYPTGAMRRPVPYTRRVKRLVKLRLRSKVTSGVSAQVQLPSRDSPSLVFPFVRTGGLVPRRRNNGIPEHSVAERYARFPLSKTRREGSLPSRSHSLPLSFAYALSLYVQSSKRRKVRSSLWLFPRRGANLDVFGIAAQALLVDKHFL
jgi:hypothetical protein